jgi:endonuclease G, mitochondrial
MGSEVRSPWLLALLLASPLAAQEPNRNARFGLPGPAKAEPSSREAFLIARPQYVLSYNAEKRIPNWVCWELKASDIGTAARAPFEPDPDLPRGFAKVTSRVYTNGGFDRGHICPAKDRSSSPKDIRATFYMTNIVPQAPNCNQRGWEKLEDYCRRLTKEGRVLYVAAGPAGVGGAGKDGRKEEIGEGRLKVTVPHKVWKVVLVLPREGAEPRKNTRVIAVIMPND